MYGAARSLLFRLDAESAHELVRDQLERLAAVPPLREAVRRMARAPERPRTVWGLRFPNPLGIAAGFDKDATMIEALEALGFGFVEVGTVTLRPQPGNPRPRLFRYPERGALVNRMGFNNGGAVAVAARLRRRVERRGTSVERRPLLVNVGKNRDVSAGSAPRAYAEAYRLVGPWADGAVVNVSSPNTPNLRELQRSESLREILSEMRSVREGLEFAEGGLHPILVKIAPDLEEGQLEQIAGVCVELAQGMIATNTTVDHSSLEGLEAQGGGLSGAPLFERSTSVLRRLRGLVGRNYPLVGVGGIRDAESARQKLEAGADLLQAYTGFIYGGPRFAARVVGGLSS